MKKSFKLIAMVTALVVIGMLCMVSCTTTYTVSFDSNGASKTYNSQSVAANGLVKEPTPAPTKDGYTFTGWYNLPSTTAWDFAKDKVTKTMTLTAGWKKTETTHNANVSWDKFTGGKATDKYLVWLSVYNEETGAWFTYDEFMQVVPATQSTYSFKLDDIKWKGLKFGAQVHLMSDGKLIAGAQTDVKDVVEFKGTEDITIPKLSLQSLAYTVSFNTMGGIPAEMPVQKVFYGEKVTEPISPVKENCIFTGWYTDEACTEANKWDFKTSVTASMTLYAGWKAIPSHNVTVSWKYDGTTTAEDTYHIWLQCLMDEGGWIIIDIASVKADQTSYVFTIKDNEWKGSKIGAYVTLASQGKKVIAAGETLAEQAVPFEGTEDITVPEITLVAVDETTI